jgi:CO/xanthine dehydrogenase FAD-binding subunit
MPSLKHAAPATVEGACSLLAEHGDEAAVLSGGQSLVQEVRQHAASFDVVVDINGIENQSYIERDGDQLRFGCLVRHADIEHSELVAEANPTLADAAGSIGDVQVRNRGTFCGAVAQAEPAGDPPTVLTLFDADVVVVGTGGERVVSGREFYEAPRETALRPDELVRELRFPILGDGTGAAYEKWTPAEGSYPVAAVGALVELEEGTVSDARLVTGALEGGPTPMPGAAARLVGEEPTDDSRTVAARTLGENAEPEADFEGSTEFKSELAATMAKDALDTAVERARGAE